MPERLSIWNAALARIGDGTILADLADPSTVANEIRRQYSGQVAVMLEMFPWRWAERVEALRSSTVTPPGTLYAYRRPSQALVIRKVSAEPERDAPSVPWRLGGATNAAGDEEQLILADRSPLYATFTRLITAEAFWPHLFAEAMTWRLAWQISFPIARDLARREECLRQMLIWLDVAKAEDQRQSYETPPESGWISARQGGSLLQPEELDGYPSLPSVPFA